MKFTIKLVITALSLWLGTTISAFAFNRPNGTILDSSGDVVVVRGDRNIPATLGMTLYPRDRLQVKEGGQLLVLCANLETQVVGSGAILPNRCGGAKEEAKCSPDLAGCPDRGTILAWGDTSIPFTVSPRRTKVLDPQPILHWNPVAGVTSYRVTVTGVSEEGGEMKWSVETTGDRVTYVPETDEQVLRSGWDYLLVVEADTGVASFEEPVQLGGMGFQLLDESTREELRSRSVALAVSRQSLLVQQAISEEAKALATARLYLEYDLVAEAILLLENVLATGKETAALHLLIGELYQDRLLVAPPASRHYQRAIALADGANLEEKALAYEGLGRVRAAMQNYTEAIDLLTQAKGIYEGLGDRDRVEELTKLIRELMEFN